MGQRLSGQAVLCFRLIHNGRKITIESGKFNSTNKIKHVNTNSSKHKVKHVNNATKHEVKQVNQTAQNTK
jgi:hypothetical protein